MKPLICERCGGKINPYKRICEYCGTYYDPEVPTLVIDRSGAEIVNAKIAVSNSLMMVGEDVIKKCVCKDIVIAIAEAIEPYVDYTIQEDLLHDKTIVKGRVRILPPDYRF